MPLATGGRITVTSTVCVEEFSLLPTMCISVSKFTGKSCEIHYRKVVYLCYVLAVATMFTMKLYVIVLLCLSYVCAKGWARVYQ